MLQFTNSKDGTRIGYLQYGTSSAPGIVLVQGAFGTAIHFEEFAKALSAKDFTVFTPDRRGRGLSPKPFDSEHTIHKDVEDLEAVLRASQASFVFGLSSGACITLQALLDLQGLIHKAIVYEPPFYDKIDPEAVVKFNTEIDENRISAAMVTAMYATGLAPSFLNYVPRRLLETLTDWGLSREDKKGPGRYPKLRELVPSLRYDFVVVADACERAQEFGANISAGHNVLLMGGSTSPQFLKDALLVLGKRVPNARLVTIQGVGHGGAWNADRRGKPEKVAAAVREFLMQ
jgi:pimeloyl-ACP methyl ester carboxylesterase